jgi:hypothetical protein
VTSLVVYERVLDSEGEHGQRRSALALARRAIRVPHRTDKCGTERTATVNSMTLKSWLSFALAPSYVRVSHEKRHELPKLDFDRGNVARRIWRCPLRDTRLIINGRPDAASDSGR